jgi:hypothetical protein
MNITLGSIGFQMRERKYRYVRQGEKTAARIIGSVLISHESEFVSFLTVPAE